MLNPCWSGISFFAARMLCSSLPLTFGVFGGPFQRHFIYCDKRLLEAAREAGVQDHRYLTPLASIRKLIEHRTQITQYLLYPRLRFAPSPTGYLHVGGARTALFNWLLRGIMEARSFCASKTPTLSAPPRRWWMGCSTGCAGWALTGTRAHTSSRNAWSCIRAAAQRLVESGHAYYCFCTKEELEQRRAQAQAQGGDPQYDRKCRGLRTCRRAGRRHAGDASAIDCTVPEFGQHIFRRRRFRPRRLRDTELEDFVLFRSDGVPTYHLSAWSAASRCA